MERFPQVSHHLHERRAEGEGNANSRTIILLIIIIAIIITIATIILVLIIVMMAMENLKQTTRSVFSDGRSRLLHHWQVFAGAAHLFRHNHQPVVVMVMVMGLIIVNMRIVFSFFVFNTVITCGFPSAMPQKKDSLISSFTSRGKGFCRFPVIMTMMTTLMTMILIRMVTGTDVDDDDNIIYEQAKDDN